MPPPRVKPPTPVVEMIPDGTASPNACVAWSTSPQVQPPPTRTVLRRRIHMDVPDQGEVDDQAIVTDAQSAGVVAAAADRNAQTSAPGRS